MSDIQGFAALVVVLGLMILLASPKEPGK